MTTSPFASVLTRRARWHLEHADCLHVLPTLPASCVDAVVTDPPYGIGYRTRREPGTQAIKNDERPFIWWLYDAFRVTREGGSLICFCRWDVQEAFRFAITLAGFRVRSQLVWDKGVPGMGDTAGQFSPSHEIMLFATKGRFTFPRGRPRSVFRAMRLHHTKTVHPTEKPVEELMRRLVASVTPVGGLVLDPFVGSGSTGEGALLEGCRFIGTELDERFVGRARERLTRAGQQNAERTGAETD